MRIRLFVRLTRVLQKNVFISQSIKDRSESWPGEIIEKSKKNNTKQDFICQTETEFGINEKKNPLIIIGIDTAKKMVDFGIRGLSFHDVCLHIKFQNVEGNIRLSRRKIAMPS